MVVYVDLSGIIFVVLALAWAVYLVPKVLRHHDELARTRSIDRFSNAMRVLARREPVDRRTARLVVSPARTVDRVLLPSRTVTVTERTEVSVETGRVASAAPVRPDARRAAARAAARRRRHILSTLLVLDGAVVTVAALSLVQWWSVAVPVALTLVYLVLCRTQVRRENDASWTGEVRTANVAPRRAIRVEAPYGTPQTPRVSTAAETDFSDEEDTVQIPVAALETVAVTVQTVDGGSLWDPLPVTLPTYVGKARAARTVRTIDLTAADTWSSGRDEADTALVEQAAAAASEQSEQELAEQEARRAVGS